MTKPVKILSMATPDNNITKILTIILGGVMTLLVAIQTWEIKEIVDIESKIGAVQGNRFTSSDGLEVWKAISEIKSNIAALPNQYPPKWFIERVDKIDSTLTKVADVVTANQRMLDEATHRIDTVSTKVDNHISETVHK